MSFWRSTEERRREETSKARRIKERRKIEVLKRITDHSNATGYQLIPIPEDIIIALDNYLNRSGPSTIEYTELTTYGYYCVCTYNFMTGSVFTTHIDTETGGFDNFARGGRLSGRFIPGLDSVNVETTIHENENGEVTEKVITHADGTEYHSFRDGEVIVQNGKRYKIPKERFLFGKYTDFIYPKN